MKKKSKDKSLTPEQCAKVLSVAEGEMKALVLVAMTTGQRIRDILTLKRVDVDRVRKIIRFSIAKTGAILETPLDPRVGIWVDQLLELTMPVEATTLLFPQLAVRGAAKAASSLRRLGRKV
jgi:integrase